MAGGMHGGGIHGGGMHGGGRAWQGVCMAGGMCGRGHARWGDVHGWQGVHGGGVILVNLFLSLSSETVFRRKPQPIAVSAVDLRRLYKWWELITEQHSVCRNALNLFQFQYLFSYFLSYGRSFITIFRVNVNIYILFIAKRVVGHYGKLVSVKIQ